MPRPAKGPRLAIRTENGRRYWIIRDGSNYRRTGCLESDLETAEQQLKAYIAEKHDPRPQGRIDKIPVADALTYYIRHRAAKHADPRNTTDFIVQLQPFWSDKTFADVNTRRSREYAAGRSTPAAARRELEVLRAAVNFYCKEHEVPFVARVELPAKSLPRHRWLTRSEAARFIHAARRRGNHHLARLILIGLYSGTRTKAIKQLRWLPSVDAGWIDLERGVMYRRGTGEAETTKRRPPTRIPGRLLAHLRRWKRLDGERPYVIHHAGFQVASLRKAWANSRTDAQLDAEVIPHILRHTAATWGMQNSADRYQLAGLLGMSLAVLESTYGHHHPDFQSDAADAIARRPGRVSER